MRKISLLLVLIAAPAVAATNVFVQAREASGGAAWASVRSIASQGTYESPGTTGRWNETVDLKSPRMTRVEDAGIVRHAHAWIGSLHWRQANRGGVHALNTAFSQQVSRTDLWLAQRRYLVDDGDGAAVSREERRSDGGVDYLVVTATPRNGQPVELWFDAATHHLARTVRHMNIDTETTRYGGYRAVGRVVLPHTFIDGDDPSSATTSHVTSYKLNAARPSDFAIPKPKKDASIAGGRTTVALVHDNYIVVQAKINGNGPFEFILDTGGHDILTPEAAKSLGLEPQGAGTSGGSGEGKVSEQYARVDRVDIGGMTMRDQVFTILPMPYNSVEQDPKAPLAGIIGLELFERFVVRLDYRAGTMTLTAFDEYRHEGAGVAVPIVFNDDEPLVRASLNGRSGDFGIDTGNTGSLIVIGNWAEREGLTLALSKGFDTMGFGMGGASHNWASRQDFEIGGAKLSRIITRYSNDKGGSFSSISEAGNVGNDILANFTLEFDYRRGQLWFTPSPGFTAPPFSRLGASVTKEGPEAFKVVNVVPNTPASDAGLKIDDEIVSVDGVPAKQVSGNEMGRIVRRAPGTRVALEVRRKGETIKTTAELRELLP